MNTKSTNPGQDHTQKRRKRFFMIDGSNALYRYFHATYKNPDGGIAMARGLASLMDRLLREYQPEAIAWVSDAGDSGRSAMDPSYKANRTKLEGDDKEIFRAGESYFLRLLEGWRIPVLRVDGYEADDVMGTMAVRVAKSPNWETILVSGDKDFLQLVGPQIHVMVLGRQGKQPVPDVLYTEANAHERLGVPASQVVDYLALVGDGTDNVPGVKGVGEKGVPDLLATFGDLESLLERAGEVKSKRYREALLAQGDAARRSKMLVTIQRDAPVPAGMDLRRQPPEPELFREACSALRLEHLAARVLAATPEVTVPARQYGHADARGGARAAAHTPAATAPAVRTPSRSR